jgi:hypothetical protein
MWRQRARVYQQPMSPWAYLLAGLGQGIETGVEQTLREREKKRNMVGEILQAVAEQRIDPALFGTESGQAFLRYQGLNKSPEIQKLMETGRERYKMPGGPIPTPFGLGGGAVNIPAITPRVVPDEQFQRLQAAEAAKARQQKFRTEELPQAIERTKAIARAGEEVRKEYEKTPEQIALENFDWYDAQKNEAEARNQPFTNATHEGVTFLTEYQKVHDEAARVDKYYVATKDYRNKISETQRFRADTMKFISGLEEMQLTPTDENFRKIAEVFPNMGLTQVKKIAIMPIEQRGATLIREGNRVIDAYNDEVKESAKQARIRPESVKAELTKHIPSYDELLKGLEEPEEPKPTTVSSVGGQVSVPPPIEKKKPSATEKDQFGYVLGEIKTARGANWEYIGNNQWRKKRF